MSREDVDKKPRPDLKKFAVYPDYWKREWGEKPLLGFVFAENVFHAQRKAYDKEIVRKNMTFQPMVKLADGSETYNVRSYNRKKNAPERLPMRRPLF